MWPELIQAIKKNNPVASTFLRAMDPTSVEGNAVKVQAFYALHRNFFDKKENKEPIETALSELLGKQVIIRCFMAEAGPATAVTIQQRRQKQETELLNTVQEAFG